MIEKKTPKVTVCLPSFAGGGMEKMRLYIIEEWLKNEVDVELVVSKARGSLFSSLPSSVNVVELSRHGKLLYPLFLFLYVLRNRDRSFLSCGHDINALVLLCCSVLSCKGNVVISFHNDFEQEKKQLLGLEKAKLKLCSSIIKFLRYKVNYVVSVSDGVNTSLSWFSFSKYQLRVIYNPVITNSLLNKIECLSKSVRKESTGKLLFVGRLVSAKGIDILLDAFKRLCSQCDVELTIIGEGPLRPSIEDWIYESGLNSNVNLLGYVADPIPYFLSHNVFLLPSRREGFGNVIVEALACGVQVVSTDCPSGPAEILEEGKFGQLVPVDDVEAFTEAIIASLNKSVAFSTSLMKNRAMAFRSPEIATRYLMLLVDYKD